MGRVTLDTGEIFDTIGRPGRDPGDARDWLFQDGTGRTLTFCTDDTGTRCLPQGGEAVAIVSLLWPVAELAGLAEGKGEAERRELATRFFQAVGRFALYGAFPPADTKGKAEGLAERVRDISEVVKTQKGEKKERLAERNSTLQRKLEAELAVCREGGREAMLRRATDALARLAQGKKPGNKECQSFIDEVFTEKKGGASQEILSRYLGDKQLFTAAVKTLAIHCDRLEDLEDPLGAVLPTGNTTRFGDFHASAVRSTLFPDLRELTTSESERQRLLEAIQRRLAGFGYIAAYGTEEALEAVPVRSYERAEAGAELATETPRDTKAKPPKRRRYSAYGNRTRAIISSVLQTQQARNGNRIDCKEAFHLYQSRDNAITTLEGFKKACESMRKKDARMKRCQ